MTAQEVELFAGQLRKIATGPTAATQRTQHAAKRVLKQQGLWRPAIEGNKSEPTPPEISH
jgi:glycerate-2-kinase